MRESPRDNREDPLESPNGNSKFMKNSRKQEDSPTSTRASNGTSTVQAQFRACAKKKAIASQARTSAHSRSPRSLGSQRITSTDDLFWMFIPTFLLFTILSCKTLISNDWFICFNLCNLCRLKLLIPIRSQFQFRRTPTAPSIASPQWWIVAGKFTNLNTMLWNPAILERPVLLPLGRNDGIQTAFDSELQR